MEGEKQYTPEEIAEFEKSRTISDSELLKRGAEYEMNGDKKVLKVTPEQIRWIKAPGIKLEFIDKYGTYTFLNNFGNMIYDAVNEDETYKPELKEKILGAIHDAFARDSDILDSIKKHRAKLESQLK